MSERRLVLITSPDCHLCEHATAVLRALGLPARAIDAASDEAQALAEGGVPLALLPVLWDGARVIAYGRFSEKRLRTELAL